MNSISNRQRLAVKWLDVAHKGVGRRKTGIIRLPRWMGLFSFQRCISSSFTLPAGSANGNQRGTEGKDLVMFA